MQGWLVVPVSLAYLGVLFLIAWYGDRQTRWLAKWRPWIVWLAHISSSDPDCETGTHHFNC